MIENLRRVAPAPDVRPQVEIPWSALEERLQCRLPADYKELVEAYGPGIFGGFIHIFQPTSPVVAIDLEEQIASSAWALNELEKGGEEIPFRLSEPSELMAVGRSDNGDVIYFRRNILGDPDSWTVVLNEARGEDWNEFGGGITDFLADALSGARRFSIFPANFPLDVVPFEPYV